MQLEFWAEFADQAHILKTAQEEHGTLDPEKPIPDDFLNALLFFRFTIGQGFRGHGPAGVDMGCLPSVEKVLPQPSIAPK